MTQGAVHRGLPPGLLTILRDRRESAAKCSLTPLRGMSGVEFVAYHPRREFDAKGSILLHPDGPPLTVDDVGGRLVLVDCSWRRLPTLLRTVRGDPVRRSLPPLVTAYPRRGAEDPGAGLASIEAAYAALTILGHHVPELLGGYEWAEEFLRLNPGLQDISPGQ